LQDLRRINKKKIIDKIFIAIPSLNEKKIKLINKKLRKFFFDIRSLPQKKFLISNKIDLNDLKIEQINSILNRNTILIKKINALKNKNILVTGAAGTIGFEICRQLVYQEANKIIGIDQSEISIYQKKNIIDKKIKLLLCDVNDTVLLNKIISKNKISLIIHAAAYKHVNILEDNIYAAVRNNIVGTKNICEAAIKNRTNLVLISTDKAAEPRSILGYSKKICEQLIHFYNSKKKKEYFNIVRFGNVFGSSGSAVSKFMEQINNNKPVTITNKSASRFFMTILEACYLVLESTSVKLKNKTFILNMGKPINIYKLALKLAQLKKNLEPSYKMKFIEIGLKKNEKLHETLFQKNELLKKINKNLFFVSNDKFNYLKFNEYFFNFEKKYRFLGKRNVLKHLKEICKI
jgi:FlaA1/EpsC-like NDP-sugar epimerase